MLKSSKGEAWRVGKQALNAVVNIYVANKVVLWKWLRTSKKLFIYWLKVVITYMHNCFFLCRKSCTTKKKEKYVYAAHNTAYIWSSEENALIFVSKKSCWIFRSIKKKEFIITKITFIQNECAKIAYILQQQHLSNCKLYAHIDFFFFFLFYRAGLMYDT